MWLAREFGRVFFGLAFGGFYVVLAGQIATILANAHAHMEERKRADALTALDRAKTEVFTTVSHEFRTPLTLMRGPPEDVLRAPDLPAPEPAHSPASQRTCRRPRQPARPPRD